MSLKFPEKKKEFIFGDLEFLKCEAKFL